MLSFRPFLIAATLALAACATGPVDRTGVSGVQAVDGDQLPQPTLADLQASSRPFRVGPFDQLTVDVFGKPELSEKDIQIDASGRIIFPLVGVIEVAGLTPAEVGMAIATRLDGRFVRNPQVTVNLKQIVSQTVNVGGEVKRPGTYPIVGRMTLQTAISAAEGWTDYSSKGDVVVFREVGGTKYAAVYNMKAIQKGSYEDPELFAKDLVIVGESGARKIWKDFLNASPLLAPIIYIIGRQ